MHQLSKRFFTRRRLLAGAITLIVLAGIGAAGGSLAWANHVSAPDRAAHLRQNTPVPLQLPTFTPTLGPPTASPSRTPTSEGRPLVEAISPETNVRGGPDITAPIAGRIAPGTRYPVIGQRFKWYHIEYPDAPGGTAWVFDEVVTLTGEASQITQYELEDLPGVDPDLLAAQQTADAITATPGAPLTLTARAQITATGILATSAPEGTATLAPGERLPTFTFPPATPTPILIPTDPPVSANESGGIPPLVPILALGSVGLMGLIISVLRRL